MRRDTKSGHFAAAGNVRAGIAAGGTSSTDEPLGMGAAAYRCVRALPRETKPTDDYALLAAGRVSVPRRPDRRLFECADYLLENQGVLTAPRTM